jgi:exosortase
LDRDTLTESRGPLGALSIGVVLFTFLAAPLIPEVVRDWIRNEDYSHGFLVPGVAAYLLWRRSGDWTWRRVERCWAGPAVVVLGVLLRLVGEVAIDHFAQRISLLVIMFGLALSMWGWRGAKTWGFPVAYLLFMIPLPGVLYNTLSLPLRSLATRMTAEIISLLGTPVFQDGNTLHLSRATLEVVDACSGIRSLISLGAISAAVGYLFLDRWRLRLLLLLATLPVAVSLNVLRLSTTALLAERFGQQIAEGFLHTVSGTAVMLLGAVTVFAIWRLLWRLEAR